MAVNFRDQFSLRPFLKTENSKSFGRNTQKLREIKICNPPKLGTADQLPELESPHRLWFFCSKSVAIRVLKTDKSVISAFFICFRRPKTKKTNSFFSTPQYGPPYGALGSFGVAPDKSGSFSNPFPALFRLHFRLTFLFGNF